MRVSPFGFALPFAFRTFFLTFMEIRFRSAIWALKIWIKNQQWTTELPVCRPSQNHVLYVWNMYFYEGKGKQEIRGSLSVTFGNILLYYNW